MFPPTDGGNPSTQVHLYVWRTDVFRVGGGCSSIWDIGKLTYFIARECVMRTVGLRWFAGGGEAGGEGEGEGKG